MMKRLASGLMCFTMVWICVSPQRTSACPFCAAVSQTFSEEIESMDAVVIARLSKPAEGAKSSFDAATSGREVSKTRFEIIEKIKGGALLSGQKYIDTIYFGEGKKGQTFLIMGVDPPNLTWSTPLKLSPTGREYLGKILTLPKEGAKRLEFFQDYLEHKDEMLARDAYDEFARAPYSAVIALKEKMKHDQLVTWIEDPDIPASRRRLYFTLLGVCGSPSDAPMLETMLKSSDRKTKAGLDAMIGCYLTLKGAQGMPLIEELFLSNEKAEYADTYAAIMALRFHGTETDVIPRPRILQGLRHMLDRPQLADLVIPDLARWQDWSVMDKLVQLFKDADEKSSWVRVPVINYLRACPKPEAKAYMKELEKIDPAAVKRANTFFPFGPASISGPTTKPTAQSKSGDAADKTGESDSASTPDAGAETENSRSSASDSKNSVGEVSPNENQAAASPPTRRGGTTGPTGVWMNPLGTMGVPILVCAILLAGAFLLFKGVGRKATAS